MTDDPLQSIETGGHPLRLVGSEMEAGLHDDPLAFVWWVQRLGRRDQVSAMIGVSTVGVAHSNTLWCGTGPSPR
jgi:hypothetical protein